MSAAASAAAAGPLDPGRLVVLTVFLALLGLAWLLARRIGAAGRARPREVVPGEWRPAAWLARAPRGVEAEGGRLRLTGSLSIGPGERVALISADGRDVLVVITRNAGAVVHPLAAPA
ncbi:flagellar biosynthetic protein FliO [Frigidibacter oleivorans]|uniref:flagellar biosynthetic protein FliO n=1 Tax=Frigidibacter oleivorans TaxID=2487129 RepID=UPI000F8EFABF|nr:flagellar biosynthetic protein FliO [Frigidibacter oleivorans]